MQFELLEFKMVEKCFCNKNISIWTKYFQEVAIKQATINSERKSILLPFDSWKGQIQKIFFIWLVSNFKSLRVKEKNCDFHTVRGALFGLRRWSYWPITFFLRFSVCVCDWSGEKERKNGDVASALQRWKALFSLFQSAEIIFCKGSAGDEENGELQAAYAARTGRQPLAAKKPRSPASGKRLFITKEHHAYPNQRISPRTGKSFLDTYGKY